MIDKAFIDTNILVYLSANNDIKTETIAKLVYILPNAVISTQVLAEFSNVAFRNKVLTGEKLIEYLEIFVSSFEIIKVSADIIIKAIKIKEKYLFSFWDSMIIASAIAANCSILYSEDMQHLQRVDDRLTIINPFKQQND